MATTNGTLKYKQDDGSIVELNPVGVDNTARASLNNIARQILCIEQTTGYNATPEDIPATSMKTSIETLNTKVTNLENAGSTKAIYYVPAVGVLTSISEHGFVLFIPMPENLLSALVIGRTVSKAVFKVIGGVGGSALLHGFKHDGTAFTVSIPNDTEVTVVGSTASITYKYTNNDKTFTAAEYGGVNVWGAAAGTFTGGLRVEVTMN